MQNASPALCARCHAPRPDDNAGCPVCLLGAGRSPETAADELFQLVCRLSLEDREPLLAEADRDTPDLAQIVRRRLSALRDPSDPAPASADPKEGPGVPPGIHDTEESPGSRIGAFQLVRCLGEGGMGTVWEAEQRTPVRRTVALKLIKLGMHTREVVKRFERERQTLALLNHPNIAQVFDAGVTPSGRPYFVMERVSGSPITEACLAEALPLRARLEVFLEVCAAVEHAHQKGVIHRDLKPSNILVGGGRVKVIDFGIAKATHEAGDSLVTRRAQILGTPAYMSPEQAQSGGADLDTRTDVYSLGGILYELLAGAPPFDSARLAQTSLADMQRILLDEDPPPPSVRRALGLSEGSIPEVPGLRISEVRGDLDRVVMKALRKDRNERYPSAAALAEDVRRFLSGEPVMAVPPTVGYRMGKFIRRHRATVAGAALTLTALIAGLVVSIQQATRARTAERSATLTLADMHTRSGLAADAAGDPSRAALWFASAAVLADADPARREANRRRAAAWRSTIPTPVRALESGFSYIGDLLWNPRHPALVVGSDPPGRSLVWDLSADRLWTPAASAQTRRALWDPTGDRIAIAADSQIRILDYPAGRERATRGGDAPTAWAFHPTDTWLAIGDPGPLLWNWQTGEEQLLPTRHQIPSQLEFNRDGSRLLIAWPDGAGVVATDRPDTLLHPLVPNASLGRVLFLGEGDRYVTSGSDGSVQIRDTRRGDVVDDYPGGDPQRGGPLAASPDGRFLARDSAPALDLTAKIPLAVPFHKNLFQAAAFGPDNALLVTGGYDDVLSLWDLPSGRSVESVGHHQHAVLRVALSPDAGWVASSQDGLIRVWRIGRPSPMTRIPTGADSLAALSPDGLLLAPSGLNRRDGALARTRAYQLPAGTPAGPELEPQGLIMDAGFPPDSRWLALAVSTTPNRGQTPFETDRGSGNLQRWDFRTGTRMGQPIALPSEPRALAVHPSGEWIALLCGDGQALEYSVTTHAIRSLFRFASPHPPVAPLHNGDCAYSPDGRWLVAWGLNDGCFVWDRATGRTCLEPVADSGTVFDVDFLGDLVLSARMNQSSGLDFRRLPDGTPGAPSIPYSNWPFRVRFHPGGEWILTTGRDRAGQVWDWRSGRRVGPALPHEGEVMAGAFVPGQPWAVTGGHDGRIRTWAIPSGMPMGPSLETPSTVLTLQFSPAARSLVACGYFGGWIALYDWDRLFPEASLNPGDARLLAELDASATINTEGGLVPMSASEWLAHWNEFRSRHPGFADPMIAPIPRP